MVLEFNQAHAIISTKRNPNRGLSVSHIRKTALYILAIRITTSCVFVLVCETI